MKNVQHIVVTIFSLVAAHAYALLFIPPSAYAQEVAQLALGKPIERELVGRQTHAYHLSLAAGQFIRVVVEQKGIDVEVRLLDASGKRLAEVDSPNEDKGEEVLFWAITSDSRLRLEVNSLNDKIAAGTYLLEWKETRPSIEADRHRLAAQQHMSAGNQFRKQRKEEAYRQAVTEFEQAGKFWEEAGEKQKLAHSQFYVAMTLAEQGQWEAAVKWYGLALPIYQSVGGGSVEATLVFNLGTASLYLGANKKALEYFEKALQLKRAMGDRAGEALTLDSLGYVYRVLGQYPKALDYSSQALLRFRAEGNKSGEMMALENIRSVYSMRGEHQKALDVANQSLQLFRARADRESEATTLADIGRIYSFMGEKQKALEYYGQALTIRKTIGDRRGEGIALKSIGVVYDELGESQKAVEYYQQSLLLIRAANDKAQEAATLTNIGIAYSESGELQPAQKYFEQVLPLWKALGLQDGIATSLLHLGRVYVALNEQEKALDYLGQALIIKQKMGDRVTEAYIINNIGEVYASQGKTQKALDHYYQALHLGRILSSREFEAAALNHLMLLWKSNQQVSLAIYYGKQSVNRYQELRAAIRGLEMDTQRTFLKTKEKTYRELADLLIAQGRLPEAEQVIRMLKDEEYFEYVRRDTNNASNTEKVALTPEEAAIEKRYREIADQITELGTERGMLLEKPSRTPEEEQRLAKLDADLTIANQIFQKFLDGLANELGKNAEASHRVFQLRESQGMMEALRDLGKGTVALYTLVGEDKYRVILTTADVQKGFAYPIKAADLNRKILAFRDVLQNPKLDPLPLAQELYQILVAPLAKDLKAAKAETLMWSLDGVLRYVPMAALHDGEKYLVERWRNVVFTPASQTRLKDDVSRNWKALGLGVTRSFGERIPALPGVAEEMRGIIKADGATSGVLPGTIKLDEQFTQEAMLIGLRQRPLVVHVASHFQFKPGNETDSALLLGDGQFMSLAQIKSLPNVFSGVELLTLSACNTAISGSGATGKEVEGFGVLAQRQGAKAVVASLWPVADRSTKNLMQEFYKLREAKTNTTKAEAMRQAQIKLLRGELQVTGEALAARSVVHEDAKAGNQPVFKIDPQAPYAHPYYWAPFILIGNWK
ncbi:MAG: tetratricopeptide repeat protein [Acidobacteria bacterium]|nr:tetratricopeptide repeat protein [Acidobacteriota bacterium]